MLEAPDQTCMRCAVQAVHSRLKLLFVVNRLQSDRKSPPLFFSCSIASCVSIPTISCSRFLPSTFPPLSFRSAILASRFLPCLTRMRGDSVAKVSRARNMAAKTPAVICGSFCCCQYEFGKQRCYRKAYPLAGRSVWNTPSSAIVGEVPNDGTEILGGSEDCNREACLCVSVRVNEL